jgi:hypothetical protein
LADGSVSPDDAPPGYAGVAELLGRARRGVRGEAAREAATVAAMSAAVLEHLGTPTTIVRGKKMLSKVLTVKAGVLAGAVLLGGGTAAAASGSLPTPAQSAVHNALSHLDISVPSGDNPSNVLKNSHALPGICNAASHNGTLTPNSTHKPNKHSVFGSVTPSTCQGVSAPGQSGTNDSNDSNDSTNDSTPKGPPSNTPGSGHATVPTPDEGSAGSGASSGAGSAGLGTAGGNDGGASSTGSGAADAGSGNATSKP